MTDRAEIVAGIAAIVARHTDADATSFDCAKPLKGQEHIDSLDLIEIAMSIEERFFGDDLSVKLDPEPDWSVDKFADLVMASLATKEAAPQT